MIRALIGWVVLLLLLSPYLVLLTQLRSFSALDYPRIGAVVGLTVLQSLLSAFGSLFVGCLGAVGLLTLNKRPKFKKLGQLFAIFPTLIPTLFVLMATLNLLPFVRGLLGVVFVHVLLNAGLVAVVISELIGVKIGKMAEVAWIEGSSRYTFFAKVALPLLRTDLMRIGFFVFAICMTSFAVPLVVGGSRFTSIEVLIYETLRISLDWSQAVTLTLLQAVLVLIFSFVLRKQAATSLASERAIDLIQWKPGLVFAFLPALFVLSGLILPLPNAAAHARELGLFIHGLFLPLLGGSIFTGLTTGLLTFFVLMLLLHARPSGLQNRILLGILTPSAVLTGFALLIFWRGGGMASLVKISLGLTLITIPAYYRLHWANLLDSLQSQVTAAKVLGASDWSITTRILVPQTISPALFLSGLSALWAWGDFALSSVVGESSVTLAMVAQDLLSSYRLPAATLLVWILILGGGLTFFLFWGAGRVLGTKS